MLLRGGGASVQLAVKGLDWGVTPAIIASIMEVAARGFASGRDYDIPAHREAQAYVTLWLAEMVKAASQNGGPARLTDGHGMTG